MTTANLTKYIKSHGIEAVAMADGRIKALEIFTKDTVVGEEWVTLKADYETVRIWLGY